MPNGTRTPTEPIKLATNVPARLACPPWCAPDACDLRWEGLDGWVGTHADALQMVTAGNLWWTVQLRQFVSPTETTGPGIALDTNTNGLDWVDAGTAEQLAAALLSASLRLRTATRSLRAA